MSKTGDLMRAVGWVLALAALLVWPACALAQTGTWTSTSSGNWSNTANWAGGAVADGASNAAYFSTIDITSDVTVHLDSPRTIGNLIFGDADTNSAANWTLDGTNTLTLAGGTPKISINALGSGKSVTISAPIDLAAGTVISNVASGTLTLAGKVTTSVGSGDMNLQKRGPGVLNITGQLFESTNTCNTIINPEGVLNFSNTTVYITSLISQPISGSTLNAYVSATNSAITINDTAGWNHGGFLVGWGDNVFSYAIQGGTLAVQADAMSLQIMGNGKGKAILSLDGGTQVNAPYIWMGEVDNSRGTMVVRDATVNCTDGIYPGGSKGAGIINQLGGSINSGVEVNLQFRMGQTTSWGIYNLNGGTLTAAAITSGDGTTGFAKNNAYFNFHGGTLSPTMNSANFIRTTLTGTNAAKAAPQVFVYAEGAVIDTGTNNITIQQPLAAPPGQGVVSGTYPIAVTNQGSGYKGAPVVLVNNAGGDTNGLVATAIANMADDGTSNGTFKIASITVVNPGINYTAVPTLTIAGGDPTTAAVLPTNLTVAANVSGGLTKLGAGTLTLTATNTYTGATIVSNGTLRLTHPAALTTNTEVYLFTASGTLDLPYTGTNKVAKLYTNNTELGVGVYGSGQLAMITSSGFLKVGEPALPPAAAFSAAPTNGFAPLTVTFADTSTNGTAAITNCFWDFGDSGLGNTNTAPSNTVSHTYNAAGAYTVVLTVYDSTNLSSSATNTISVGTVPPPNFLGGGSAISMNPSTGKATFTLTATNGVQYRMVYKDDLLTNAWTAVTPPLPDGWTIGTNNGPITLQDTNTVGVTRRFYRVEAKSVDAP